MWDSRRRVLQYVIDCLWWVAGVTEIKTPVRELLLMGLKGTLELNDIVRFHLGTYVDAS